MPTSCCVLLSAPVQLEQLVVSPQRELVPRRLDDPRVLDRLLAVEVGRRDARRAVAAEEHHRFYERRLRDDAVQAVLQRQRHHHRAQLVSPPSKGQDRRSSS